ncbi:MAG: glycosyltransferase [Burkholderiales bacterium]|nr:MAG: glycosyltransferase [Burkholderiales bacterium]
MNVSRVAVTILAHNHARYIERCLLSVVEQAGEVDLHILVGDDASDDGTSEIISAIAAAHPGLVTHVRHPSRIGGSDNYRYVLTHAKARYIAHLDGDDWWLPGKLKAQLARIEDRPDVVAVYANAITVREDGSEIGLFNDAGDVDIDLGGLLRHGNFLNNSSMLFRSELVAAALAVEGPVLDWHVHLSHAGHGLLAHIGTPCVVYRVGSQGSALAGANDFVRELYWQAILSVSREAVGDACFGEAVADFMRRVLVRALRTRRPSLLREWVPRVLAASPHAWPRTALAVAASLARTGWKGLLCRQRLPDGRKVSVMYPR